MHAQVGRTRVPPTTPPGRTVSVVIPTRDRQGLLGRALRCVLAQEDVSVEVIVVNDGSTDGTAKFLDEHPDGRVSAVHHAASGGVARARNVGLARATAPWVAFLDDDDLWGPRRLAAQLDALEGSGAQWAFSDAVLVKRRLSVIGVQAGTPGLDVRRAILQANVIPGGASAVIASTELVMDVGGFDGACNGVEDWDLWTRLAQASPVVGVPRPDVGYFLHAGSLSTNVERMSRARDALLAKHEATRRSLDVRPDEVWWDRYVLGLHLAAGDRVNAARSKATLPHRSGRLAHAAGVAVTLVAPGAVALRQRRRQLRTYDTHMIAEAERWLAPLRQAHRPGARPTC